MEALKLITKEHTTQSQYVEDNSAKLIIGAYIKQSRYRKAVIDYLGKNTIGTPTQIAKGTGIRTNHISKVLSELKKKKVLICINEDMRKGRLYKLTDFGFEVVDLLNDTGVMI